MALIRRLSERRKIRRTAEQSLAQNPMFASPPPPAAPQYPRPPRPNADAPETPAPSAIVAEPSSEHSPQPAATVDERAATRGSAAATDPTPPNPATPDRGDEVTRTPSATTAAAVPAESPQQQWQLPQWQYTTKRTRTNQRQQRSPGR